MAVGNRQRYTFTIKYDNGATKRNGTAVGRDLQEVLKRSREFQKFANGKNITISLKGNFYLRMDVDDSQNNAS